MKLFLTLTVVVFGASLVSGYTEEDFEAEGSQNVYGFNSRGNNNNLPLFDQPDFGNNANSHSQGFRPTQRYRDRGSSSPGFSHRYGNPNGNGNAPPPLNFRNTEGPDEHSSNSNNGHAATASSRKIHKFISIHVAPPEQSEEKPKKPIKLPQKAEKHYQIVFIKAPSSSPQGPQEIQLPSPPELKTLVYVLLKKKSAEDSVRIKAPSTPKPSPPEVFFIRYKGQGEKDQEREEGSNGDEGAGDEEEGYGAELQN